jgi:NAD(P)-dependent dehydrogenase (short-subunit alcohol dehydrogenase family)
VNLEAVQKAAGIVGQRYPNIKALAVRADVGQESDVKAAVDTAVEEFGRLDIMVLCLLLHLRRGLESFLVQQRWQVFPEALVVTLTPFGV